MPKTPAPAGGASRGAMHQRRVRRLLLVCSAIVAADSVGWGIFFGLRGTWSTVAIDIAMLVVAGATVALVRAGRLRNASRLLIAVLYAVLCFNAGVLDLPSLEVPRSMHVYLLSLGVMSCLLTREEPSWLRYGIPLLCFATFLCFSASNGGWVTSLALPDDVRVGGSWINNALALVVIFATLHIIQSDVAVRNDLESDLRDALLNQELSLHYQPQVDVHGRVMGAEALLRWSHSKRGNVSPADFIPIAEQCGLMQPLGDWVLRTACRQLVQWSLRPETASLTLAVNVSAAQFTQADFVARVTHVVADSGANPARLKLELTESMLVHDLEDIIAKMTSLKMLGIAFSLDDFGTGFSSLAYLRRLPLDQLKIDQLFVRDMLSSSNGAGIVQAVVTLGHTLGLDVIAEGVETAEQCEFLSRLGCLRYQGYLFSKPVPIADFDNFLSRSLPSPRPSSAPASVPCESAA
ncbi:EAL domain-containing protein [soil metagenome]